MHSRSFNNKIIYIMFALLTFPLILNGYPILFADTATYIGAYTNLSSFYGPPISRPISYGFFLFLASIGKSSLFYVALLQDFLMAYLISKACRINNLNMNLILLLLYLPISYIAILANTILTDVWLSMGYLSAYLIILADNKKSPLLFLMIFACGAFSPANGIIIFLSIFLLWIIMRFKKSKEVLLISLTIISSLLLLSYDNYISHNSFSPIAGSNTFWVGRLIGEGLAQNQINKLCTEKNYRNTSPCINKEQYLDRSGQEFLWGTYKNNFSPWNLRYKNFFSAVKTQTLIHNPVAFSYNVWQSGLETLMSLPHNLNQLYGRYNKKTADNWVYRTIRMYFNYHQMMRAWQQSSTKSFNYLPVTNIGILVILFFTLIANFNYIKNNVNSFILLSVYSFSCIILNAFIDGGLSMVNPRYNVKGLGIIVILYCFILASRGFIVNSSKT